jgi:hypothetical protein
MFPAVTGHPKGSYSSTRPIHLTRAPRTAYKRLNGWDYGGCGSRVSSGVRDERVDQLGSVLDTLEVTGQVPAPGVSA